MRCAGFRKQMTFTVAILVHGGVTRWPNLASLCFRVAPPLRSEPQRIAPMRAFYVVILATALVGVCAATPAADDRASVKPVRTAVDGDVEPQSERKTVVMPLAFCKKVVFECLDGGCSITGGECVNNCSHCQHSALQNG